MRVCKRVLSSMKSHYKPGGAVERVGRVNNATPQATLHPSSLFTRHSTPPSPHTYSTPHGLDGLIALPQLELGEGQVGRGEGEARGELGRAAEVAQSFLILAQA